MRRAFIVSLLLHVAVIGALVVGLPHLGRDLPPDEPITVDLVSDAKDPAPSPPPPRCAPEGGGPPRRGPQGRRSPRPPPCRSARPRRGPPRLRRPRPRRSR